MQKKRLAIFILLLLIFSYIFPLIQVYAATGSVRYEVHLRDLGWRNTVYDGNIAGTTGQSRRMEAIAIASERSRWKSYLSSSCSRLWMVRKSFRRICGRNNR